MKKILVALCAVALIGLTGCQKEQVTPENTTTQNSGNGNPSDPPASSQEVDRAGLYAPCSKIASISTDGALSETWNWQDGKLTDVTNAAGQTKVSFTYRSDDRVNTMTVNATDMFSGNVNVTYDGERISQLALSGDNSISAQLTNNGNNKVTKAVLNLDNVDMNTLLGLFQSAVSQFLGNSNVSDIITGVDSLQGSMAFSWADANVSRSIINIGLRLATTIGRVAAILPDTSQYAAAIQQIAASNPNMPLYIKLTYKDTSNYAYDQMVNPFRHYMGDMVTIEGNVPHFNISALSANNVSREQRAASAEINVSAVVSFMGSQMVTPLYNTSQPMADNETTYSYTYRSDNYPETVTRNDGQTKTYTYQQ